MKNCAILICLLLAATVPSITASCRFFVDPYYGYTCELNDVEVTEENFNLVINTDNHDTGMTDASVTGFTVGSSANLRFFPGSIMRQFPNIRYLVLDDAGLTELTPGSFDDSCTNLVILYLRYNEIERIPAGLFSQCPQIGIIEFSNNQISEIDDEAFDGLSNILELDIYNNRLTRISSRVFRDIVNVELLTLNYNEISEIEEGAFATLTGLITLYLSNNQIAEITPEMFGTQFPLVFLTLNHNELTSIPRLPANAPGLRYVYLLANYIAEINEGDFGAGYADVTNLDISENLLRSISAAPFETLENLDALALNYNGMTALDNEFFERIGSLITFYFEGNQCADASFNNIRSIDQEDVIAETFDRCYYNFFEAEISEACNFVEDSELGYTCELSDITFLNFRDKFTITGAHIGTRTNEDVAAVRITSSNFVRVPPTIFRTFPSLESLSLTNSGLENVGYGAFEECGEITNMDLSGNRIRQLNLNAFENCYRIDRINLDNNQITEIAPCSSFLLNIPFVTHLSMRNNICIDRVFESGSWLLDDYQYNVYRHLNRCFSLFYLFLDRVNSDL